MIDIIKVLGPFILGLFASVIIDLRRDYKRNKRSKKFILNYLKSTILPELPKVELDYQNVKMNIENYSNEKIKVQVFETFNSNILKAIEPVEYYAIFKEKYTLLNEIISTIEFLSQNLPLKISNEFYDILNKHLKEKNKIGDLEHEKGCGYCLDNRLRIISIIDFRLNEINEVRDKIKTFLR